MNNQSKSETIELIAEMPYWRVYTDKIEARGSYYSAWLWTDIQTHEQLVMAMRSMMMLPWWSTAAYAELIDCHRSYCPENPKEEV